MGLDTYRVREGAKFRLKDQDPGDTGKFESKEQGKARLAQGIARLRELQDRLYAQDRWAVLLIFQAMDAAGKDSVIEHVMSGVNPQGCQVYSFKQPSSEELDHDFLWRTTRCLPERGRIGVFNRSYYEEVLVVRVHPEILAGQHLPSDRITPGIWRERFDDINAFERHLWRSGTVVRKFFLHISREEQRKRLLARLDDPAKNWKFQPGDLAERAKWRAYMKTYREAIAATSTAHSPWYVIPADHKWFAHVLISEIVVQTLDALDLSFPKLTRAQRQALRDGRRRLESER